LKSLFIIILISTLSFANVIQKDNNKSISDTKIEKEHISIVKKIGFSSKDGIVSIDTNKAKNYFSDLGNNIKNKSKQLSVELKSKTLKITKDIGIELDKGSLSIDLNKTKEFADRVGKNIKIFTNDINDFTKKLKAEINGSI